MKIYFKHSTRCPISAGAKREMDRFLESKPDSIEFEMIDVISNRSRSNEIAEQFGIKHESPQVILTNDSGIVLWNASHRQITRENLNRAIEANR